MKQCNICGEFVEDDALFCNMCGAPLSGNQVNNQNDEQTSYQQQLLNQQIEEQQKIINSMLEQQKQMAQKMEQNQQPQYIYMPTKVQTELYVRNKLALAAAVVCFISMFLGILLDSSMIDIASACSSLSSYADGADKFALIMVALMPWITGALAITLVVCAFTGDHKTLRELLLTAHFFSFLCMFSMLEDIFYSIEFSDFQLGFWVIIVGFIMALRSKNTDSGPKDTSVYAPRRSLGNGVSDSKSKSLEEVQREMQNKK